MTEVEENMEKREKIKWKKETTEENGMTRGRGTRRKREAEKKED